MISYDKQATAALIAASIMDELHPHILRAIAKALDQESIDLPKVVRHAPKNESSMAQQPESKYRELLKKAVSSMSVRAITSKHLAKGIFMDYVSEDVNKDTADKGFRRAWAQLVKEGFIK